MMPKMPKKNFDEKMPIMPTRNFDDKMSTRYFTSGKSRRRGYQEMPTRNFYEKMSMSTIPKMPARNFEKRPMPKIPMRKCRCRKCKSECQTRRKWVFYIMEINGH